MKKIIVDANRCGDFTAPLSGHASVLISKLRIGDLTLAIGGKLLVEISKTKLIGFVSELVKAGRAIRVDDSVVHKETLFVASIGILSDDPHVVALARVADVRLLYTEDGLLIKDFRDPKLLSPRGKIITRRTPLNRVKRMIG